MSIDADNCISETSRRLTDADLVRSARAGDAGAFDCLVLRHRASVLYKARAGVNDWEQAEDVAQQALVEAYKSLRGLREGTSFRAWLMTITRRCASRYREREASQPDAIELSEAMICSIPSPRPYPGIDEVTERVRASLSELSARSRLVVTLHYLDGYSCKEIGSRLGIPAGTVKRILHESRNNLRAKIGIAKGDVGRMEVIDKQKSAKGPRNLIWWINGNWPGSMFQTLLAQSIALTVNKQPMTISEIGKAVDANVRFVEEALTPLVKEELVVKVGRKHVTNFIALDADDWIEITKETRREAGKLADVLSAHLPTLQHAWEKTSLPLRGFAWPESMWTMLAILVGNHGVSRNGFQEATPPLHGGSGKTYWPGGREVVGDEHVLWGTGFDNSGPPKAGPFLRCGLFWSDGLGRGRTGWNEERSRVWAAIAWGDDDVDSVSVTAELSVDRTREIVAREIEYGLIERQADKLRLTFPVFGSDEDAVLCPTVDAIAGQLCSEIIGPATANVTDMLRGLGYGHLEEHFSPWRRWLEGNVVGESLRELLKRGVLPNFGECAPVNFAMVGWTAPIRLFSWSS